MSITVTATEGGTTANGIALTVKVLTGAAPVQPGQTATSATANPPQLAITPNASASWVYGGASINSATLYTPNAATTFSQNVNSGTVLGTFRTTATTTAATPVTVGASAPASAADIALVEILAAAGLSLAEDASSPAGVNAAAATTVATAAFTPPGGTLLVAMTATNATGSGTVTMTVSGGGLTWTQAAFANSATTAYAGVWLARVPLIIPSVRAIQAVKRAAFY
jgi:hypothetical protein